MAKGKGKTPQPPEPETPPPTESKKPLPRDEFGFEMDDEVIGEFVSDEDEEVEQPPMQLHVPSRPTTAPEPQTKQHEAPKQELKPVTTAIKPTVAVKKVDAIRAALKKGIASPKEAVNWIKTEYGIDVDTSHFSNYKTHLSKQAGTQLAPSTTPTPVPVRKPAIIPPPARNSPAPARSAGITVDEISQLKALITQHGAAEITQLVEVLSR